MSSWLWRKVWTSDPSYKGAGDVIAHAYALFHPANEKLSTGTTGAAASEWSFSALSGSSGMRKLEISMFPFEKVRSGQALPEPAVVRELHVLPTTSYTCPLRVHLYGQFLLDQTLR
jgi:hypothetical protein